MRRDNSLNIHRFLSDVSAGRRAVEMDFLLSLSDLGGGGYYWMSERQTDLQLLRACAEHRSEPAFADVGDDVRSL